VGLDVGDPAGVAGAVLALSDVPGRLDVLVNNAAAYVDWTETATGADLDAARRVMEINLFAAWRLTQAVRPCSAAAPLRAPSTSAAAPAPTAIVPSACAPATVPPPATASGRPRSTR
jgi:NAD(P)-dependent dehydrogenase (short-subunit alcohol dehydrogenase family)